MHPAVRTLRAVTLCALFFLALALATFLQVSASRTAAAATYTPTSAVKFCNALAADFPSSIPANDADLLGNPACAEGAIPAGVARDYTVTFTVPGGDSNFGSSVVTNTPGSVAWDAAIPDGEKVGGLRSDVTLSLLNGPCSTALVAEFVLYDSATTGAATVPNPEGTSNRWGAAGTPIVTDANLDEIADSTSLAVTSNVSIYETLFTPTGGAYMPPLARYTGLTRVPSAGDWQLLSFFQFDASTLAPYATNASDAPHIFGRVSHTPATGTHALAILNDPTAAQGAVGPIHDFCAPLVVQTMLKGTTPGGWVRYTTPAAGTAGISSFSYGQRDLDGDGFENAYDTCPFAFNIGDPGGDGIDDSCDPTPGANTGGGDHDGDGFQNRQDNCPTVANGVPNQLDSEVAAVNTYVTVAPDGGPKADGIGDQCEADDFVANGAFVEAYNLVVKCIGGADADNDGYCAPQDVNDANAAVAGFTINPGMDQEYQNPPGDSFGGNTETYLGSNPLKSCGFTAGGQTWSENWPFDLVESNSINISDVLALKPVFSGTVPAVDKHFDLAPSKAINISDVLALKPAFGTSCLAAPPPGPPMPCPAAAALLANAGITAAINQAWTDSQPAVYGSRHEEGGWIIFNVRTSALRVQRWPRLPLPQGQSQINDVPAVLGANERVCGEFHTHPNPPLDEDGIVWLQGPSAGDIAAADAGKMPGIIRNAAGTVIYGAFNPAP